jgi:hypothetical protein
MHLRGASLSACQSSIADEDELRGMTLSFWLLLLVKAMKRLTDLMMQLHEQIICGPPQSTACWWESKGFNLVGTACCLDVAGGKNLPVSFDESVQI